VKGGGRQEGGVSEEFLRRGKKKKITRKPAGRRRGTGCTGGSELAGKKRLNAGTRAAQKKSSQIKKRGKYG